MSTIKPDFDQGQVFVRCDNSDCAWQTWADDEDDDRKVNGQCPVCHGGILLPFAVIHFDDNPVRHEVYEEWLRQMDFISLADDLLHENPVIPQPLHTRLLGGGGPDVNVETATNIAREMAQNALRLLHDSIYYDDQVPADKPLTSYELCRKIQLAIEQMGAKE